MCITGATDGIGKTAALELAKAGCTLALVGRNPDKGNRVLEEIIRDSGNENIRFHICDLSLMEAVRKLAKELQTDYDRLDVLLNNAGAYFSEFEKTDEGFERTFALNHLSYFLLTDLLLDILEKTGNARIVNVASDAHQGAELSFENLQGFDGYKGWPAYCKSKLANIMYTYELDRRISGKGITANSLHPGFVDTNFGNNNTGTVRVGLNAAKKVGAISPEKGALTSIYLASSPEVEGVSGKYFYKCKQKNSNKASYVKSDQEKLWQITETYLA
jgi:NAD(P)-dependent dehydrogenase (short-subunit alcohol dehydrogenase family)